MKTSNCRFKRPSGTTRWVANQSDAIDAFLVNLSLLFGYLNNQIADPYNATMKKEVPRLQCVLSFCSNLVTLVFQAAKLDILNLIKPTSLVLQSTNLLLPEAVTTIDVTVTKIKKLQSKFDEKGTDALQDKSLFPTLNSEFMPLIDFDTNGYSLGRSTRRDPAYNGVILHSGYTLSNGDIEKALEKVFQDLHLDLPVLEEDLNERLSFITEEPVFSAAAKRLDTTAYQNLEEGNLLEACETLVEPFKVPLEANGFIKTRLRSFLLFLFCEFVF